MSLKVYINKLGKFIDKLILPSIESHQKRYKKNKRKIQKDVIKHITFKVEDLKNIILDTNEEIDFVSIYFRDYEDLIKDLKENKPIKSSYKEDGIKKDIMLTLYKIRDSKGQIWILVVDMTNSPNIGLRDYWLVP